jgi:predicted O-methyltransferase YrrM
MEIRSSYMSNNIGEFIFNTILAFPPGRAVELGVLDGYSSFHIAKAFQIMKLRNTILEAYDLFEDYPYKHGSMESVSEYLSLVGVKEYVNLFKENAFIVHKKYKDDSIDFIHIDISNDGDIFNFMIEKWTPKLRHCGILLFEGGSEERDNVEWMIKYAKKPIRPEMNSNKIFNENYIYGTMEKFPSITVAKKVTR